MILHLGSDAFVPLSSVVAVLDVRAHPEFMAREGDGDVVRIGGQEIKSLVVTAAGTRRMFFLSPISAQTLRKRAQERISTNEVIQQ